MPADAVRASRSPDRAEDLLGCPSGLRPARRIGGAGVSRPF